MRLRTCRLTGLVSLKGLMLISCIASVALFLKIQHPQELAVKKILSQSLIKAQSSTLTSNESEDITYINITDNGEDITFSNIVDNAQMDNIYKNETLIKLNTMVENAMKFQADNDTEIERCMQQRRQKIRETCHRKKSKKIRLSKNILVDDNLKVIYCYIPKVSSTYIIKSLIHLSKGNISLPVDIHYDGKYVTRLLKYKKADILYRLKTYTKFTFVREPFSRLLSAYNDKIVRSGDDHFSKHRKKLLEKYHKNSGTKIMSIAPFVDFVDYAVLQRKLPNEHWLPFFQLCSPCNVQYDYIGKYENLAKEGNFIFKKLGAKHSVIEEKPYNKSKNLSMEKAYSTLSINQLENLSEFYKMDFDLFEYPFPQALRAHYPTERSSRGI
ncbi:unnamed protein product [Owenia fusiformis]|uniref:Carbohydrate sulfotransferase n=1 Tax=Owenia fusiformis TaxID=6347 RepID=A0A8S4P7I8_OWEFU|nr:unnamed protein product [Owenia fusiformis]